MQYIKSIVSALFVSAALLTTSGVHAAFISFDTVPTDTTYIADGLLLGSDNGSYITGGCVNLTVGSNGCLAGSSFTSDLLFTFVAPNTTTQAVTDSFEIILCEGCNFRGSSANVFDAFGALLTTIDMNTAAGLGSRTFSYAAAGIGSIFVDLGAGSDGVQSLQFGNIATTCRGAANRTSRR